MRFPLLLLAVLAAVPAHAGVWTRVSPDVMRFEGSIERGEYDRFAAVFSPAVRELHVRSGGGLTDEGIRIGLALAATSVKVVVVGKCLSSCANYLFVAGHQREIRGGLVGFHGNVQACFGGPDDPEADDAGFERWMRERGESEETIRRSLERSREQRTREQRASNRERLERQIADEARLLRIMGVSQQLFDRSCTDDMGAGDGGTYDFWLPRRASFERYGLWGIVGEQDRAAMAAAHFTYLYD